MKTTIQSILITLLFVPILSAQSPIEYEAKVRKMLELTGAVENFNITVTNMLEVQKETHMGALGKEFFNQMEAEMKEVGIEKLVPMLVPIYEKYLTEEDLDGIILFYESEVGRKLIQKTPSILQDAIDVGEEWGEKIAKEIINRIENSNQVKFEKEIATDCSNFKQGVFEYFDGELKYQIERTGNFQIEKYGGKSYKMEIEWISNNRYVLRKHKPSENSDSYGDLVINIYEVEGDTCKWIGKYEKIDYFLEGILRKVK